MRISLTKHVPHGAGLGGGSSDAATVLLALNQLTQEHLPVTELAAIAAELGSDVPFFVYRGAAVCQGRGEIIEPASFAPVAAAGPVQAGISDPDPLGLPAMAGFARTARRSLRPAGVSLG